MRQQTELTAFKPRPDSRRLKSRDGGEFGKMYSSIAEETPAFEVYDLPMTYTSNNVSNYYSASSLIN